MASGHTVRILDKNDSLIYPELRVHADVRDIKSLIENLSDIDLVINLAAEHRDDVSPKSLYDDVNVDGAENVCKACSEKGIKKIIFTSSVAVYGFAPLGTDETGSINYFNDYGRTKWLAEGKYRDWLYVEDHARALYTVLMQGKIGETYNIGGHNEKKNIEVVKTICKILDELRPAEKPYDSLITFVADRPGHDRRYAIDSEKMQKELGWTPQETFETGLRKTVQWYLNNEPWWKSVLNGSYKLERLGSKA